MGIDMDGNSTTVKCIITILENEKVIVPKDLYY